ncbi:MAG: nucleoside kinase [candidate division WOR-3 bacterium]|nr:MAG: nucleoside kinase [candidate division WOR-3 bacterium]
MVSNKTIQTGDLKKLNEWRSYQSTLSLILYAAVKRLFPKRKLRIEHSMSRGFYCKLGTKIDPAMVKKIERRMRKLIDENLPIQQASFPREKAAYLFNNLGQPDKVKLLTNIRKKHVTLYSLLDVYDMYIIPPFDTTARVPLFYLRHFSPGFVMIFPTWQDLSKLPEFVPQPRLNRIFNEYVEWARILEIDDVGPLNAVIKNGGGPQIIKIVEALHEKKIAQIADRIVKERSKVVLVAGPSSAGKTTFTKRLAIQLIVNGTRPLVISTDNYFQPHSKTPRDEYGKLDFETIEAVDTALMNTHLLQIINGRTITVPKFNFVTGRRIKGHVVKGKDFDVVLLEGIHCLNDQLTHRIRRDIKFKIYISALTQLNIDDHNRISTTDTRLIRRLVRDTHFRGYRTREVLKLWGRVIRGEEGNIYPYQEEADEMFNSALVYEPGVLKRFCVPLLKRIAKRSSEFAEAKRLIDFLNLFYDLSGRDVPSNSILREFIGGSSFVY